MQSPLPVSRDYEAPISAWSFQTLFEHGGTQLSLFTNNARVPTSPAYTPDNAVYNDEAFNDNDLLVVSGSHTRNIRRVTSTSTVTFSRHELDPQSGYWNVFSNMTKSHNYAYGSMLKFDEQLSWKPALNMTLVSGATFERFFAIPQGADLNAPITSRDVPGTILGTNIPDEFVKLRYTNTGVYAQWQYAATPHLALTVGARGDYNTRYGGTFNPRAGLVLKTDNDTTLKLLYGTAYLAPSPYEAYSHYGSFYTTDGGQTYASDYWHVPNPDLRPQQKKTVEVNVLQPIDESFVASASVFYSWLTDLRLPADPDQAYSGFYLGWPVAYIDFAVNEGSANTYGATLALDFAASFSPGLPRAGARRAQRRRWPRAVRCNTGGDDAPYSDRRHVARRSALRRRCRVGPLDRGASTGHHRTPASPGGGRDWRRRHAQDARWLHAPRYQHPPASGVPERRSVPDSSTTRWTRATVISTCAPTRIPRS